MAAGMLRRFPDVHLTVADIDPRMVRRAGFTGARLRTGRLTLRWVAERGV